MMDHSLYNLNYLYSFVSDVYVSDLGLKMDVNNEYTQVKRFNFDLVR